MGGCVCCSPPYPQKAHVLLIDELPAGPFGYVTVIRIYIAHYIWEELGLLPISLVLCCVLCLLPCFKLTTEVRAKGSQWPSAGCLCKGQRSQSQGRAAALLTAVS